MNIDEENRQDGEVDKRIAKYNSSIGALYPLLKEKYIPRKCKLEIYRTILRPMQLHEAESWALNARAQSKLQGAEMRVLRAVKGVTRRDRVRNLDIRRELRVEPLQEEIERIQLRWYGHVIYIYIQFFFAIQPRPSRVKWSFAATCDVINPCLKVAVFLIFPRLS